MGKKMDLLDRIDEVTANSVTREEFKETWGYSMEEHVADMMDRIHRLEASDVPAEERIAAKEARLQPAAVPAAAAAAAKEKKAAKRKVFLYESESESETMKEVAATIQELAKKLAKLGIVTLKEQKEEENAKGRRAGKQRVATTEWAIKLLAVPTGSGKSIATGAPVVIRTLDNPAEEGKLVARVYSPGKMGKLVLPEIKFEGTSLKMLDPTEGVKGLMVDVGGLKVGELAGAAPKGSSVKGPRGPKM